MRVSEDDFRVEELPLYEPCGEGEHLYLTVEKRGRTTQEVAREIARALGARERDAGSAGLKDKRAVAVQRISVLTRAPPSEALQVVGPGFRVLEAKRHLNKLRPGHLRGNRFRILLRGCVPDAPARAGKIAASIEEQGVANLFGPQRFGKRGDNAELGGAILRREANVRDRFLRKLALSALQAELFNRCLAGRLEEGLFARALAGDVLRKRETGGLFVSDDLRQERRDLRLPGEVDPAGPLPGHSLFAARGDALAREAAIVEDAGVDPATFAVGGGELAGARRPYRIPAADLEIRSGGEDSLVLAFSLPPGSYAASIVREIVKAEVDEPGGE